MVRFSTYDIFSGSPDEKFVWLEAADDLPAASERLKQLSINHPGEYFVYCCRTHSVVTQVNTSSQVSSE